MEAITSHRCVQGEDDCEECGEPRYRHWFTDRYDSPEDREMQEEYDDMVRAPRDPFTGR